MENLKFSVVTVSYNHAEFIRDNIESVLAQDYGNFEHIIIDGGSTDDTLSILNEYQHLQWTSEPDRGQSDALNKGFSRASGDIVVWLNSDDWLAPKVFPEVAEAITGRDVVMGAAARTDRAGNVVEVVPNVSRSWFDLLKYWVPYAWLAQTGVFFRRDLLEAVRRSNGSYVDEDLYFVMDYDLWMRMAENCPFENRLERVCAYFRMYEDNKTGRDGEATQRECARVYRRYANLALVPERRHAIVIPVGDFEDPKLRATFVSIVEQDVRDLEIVCVNHNSQLSQSEYREVVKNLDLQLRDFSTRAVTHPSTTALEAFTAGGDACNASYLTFLVPGACLGPNFLRTVDNLFAVPALGMALPLVGRETLVEQLDPQGQQVLTSPQRLLESEFIFPQFAVKKLAFLNVLGFRYPEFTSMGVLDFVLRVLLNSWGVSVRNQLQVQDKFVATTEFERLKLFHLYVVSELISAIEADFVHDPFRAYKVEQGVGFAFSDELVSNARRVLQTAPKQWHVLMESTEQAELERITASHPNFAPAWALLAQVFDRVGNQQKFEQCRVAYQRAEQAWDR